MLVTLIQLALGAETVDIGIGVRNTPNAMVGPTAGLRPAARVMVTGGVGVEAGLYLALPGARPSSLTQTLIGVTFAGDSETSFQQPCPKEAGSLELLAVVSPWRIPREGGVTLWPSAVAGVDGLLVTDHVATVNERYAEGASDEPASLSEPGAPSPHVGVTGGLAFEATVANRVVVRVLGVWRAYVAAEPDYGDREANGDPVALDPQVYVAPAVSLDVLVRL